MPKDVLFLLPPGFEDNDRREFCPECAELWGVLNYYPAIKDALDIIHVGIHHPRTEITALLGDGKHNAPTLVLHPDTVIDPDLQIKEANGLRYLPSAHLIARQRLAHAPDIRLIKRSRLINLVDPIAEQ